jgi:alkanesulfonate monooxygenase SsuD/methylene tetrahydromethanopterin reductase-like flavin-dependent oxidoreductase (luciferase family)
VKFGLALPQYDYSVAGETPLSFATIVDYAHAAERLGFDSVWLSDHLFLDLGKYGGPSEPQACYEPLVTLAALSRVVERVRLGTLVLCEALRPATVTAKALATLDRVSGGRVDVGLGAGWYEPEYDAIGMALPRPGVRLARLGEALDIVTNLLGGGPYTFAGVHHRAVEALNIPPALQQPRPRVFLGGSGDRLLDLVARAADGWNTCWAWTTDAYRDKLAVLDAACARHDRDPASVWRTLGLYTLVGENDADLRARFARLQDTSPPGIKTLSDFDTFREGRLVGTVEQVRDQIGQWATLGVDTIICGFGAVPFQVGPVDELEMLAEAAR